MMGRIDEELRLPLTPLERQKKRRSPQGIGGGSGGGISGERAQGCARVRA